MWDININLFHAEDNFIEYVHSCIGLDILAKLLPTNVAMDQSFSNLLVLPNTGGFWGLGTQPNIGQGCEDLRTLALN
jgi:hypothetical protein